MDYLNFGAIPQRSLPLRGWTKWSIPGREIPAVSTAPPVGGMPGGGYATDYRQARDIRRDDKEIMELVAIIVQSGILD